MTTWTDDRVETLKRGWADGKSAELIARELNGRDGTLSRNAVIGKATRIGLAKRATVMFTAHGTTIKKAKTPKPRVSDNNLGWRLARRQEAVPPKPAPIPEVIAPLTLEHKLHFMSAENHHCHWPLWGDDTPFAEKFMCGSPGCDVNERRPYCVHHARMSIGTPIPRRPQKYWTQNAA